ncbi:MAG TPA: hypothetical protein VF491_10435 [Vicinamibacterales bacterium]
MARKSEKGQSTTNKAAIEPAPEASALESGVVKLAEQLGWFVGTVQAKTDGWLDNETLKQQMTQIRDGASQLLEQVNRAGAAAGESATKLATAAKSAMPAMPVMPATKAKKAEAAKREAAAQKRQQSRKAVAAPGKKHRKPPPQDKGQRGMGATAMKKQGVRTFAAGHGKRG